MWDVVEADPELTLFAQAVDDAGLVELLDGTMTLVDLSGLLEIDLQLELGLDPALDSITVLAPTNAVIEALPNWAEIEADPAALRRFVLSHVVPDDYLVTDIFEETELTTLNEDVLTIDPEAQTINGAHIVTPDRPAPNGVIHTIDAFLIVPTLAPPPSTTTTVFETLPATVPEPTAEPIPATPPATPTDTSGG